MTRHLLVLFPLSVLLALGACAPKPELATSATTATVAGTATNENPFSCGVTAQKWSAKFQSDQCLLADNQTLPTIAPILWPDVCTPMTGAGWTPSQSSFDQLSWRNFLYAVWPADPSQPPGTPDPDQRIGAMQGGKFLPTVWESFMSAEDLFNPGGRVPAGCSANGPRILTETSKVPAADFHAVADAGRLGSIDQAFSGPLVDQNGKLVYYEIRVNAVESSYILHKGAQKKPPDELNCTQQNPPRDCKPFEFPFGSMEFKAAWKQLSDQEVRSGRFYSQPFQLAQPHGQCPTVTMGLVGLHIIHKTPSSFPAWAWSTFEHVDNVPAPNGSGGTYSFFNSSCSPKASAALCDQAQKSKDKSDPEYACCENLDRYGRGTLPVALKPSQITRLDDPPAETHRCNAVYARTQRGIWDNYSLVATQWPRPTHPSLRGRDGGDGGVGYIITPPHLRSAVTESYFAQWEKDGSQLKQVSTSSCMDCHSGGSPAVDMSYLFLRNVSK